LTCFFPEPLDDFSLLSPEGAGAPPEEPSVAMALPAQIASTPATTSTTINRNPIGLTFSLRAYGVS
jgi:hypothetical protein